MSYPFPPFSRLHRRSPVLVVASAIVLCAPVLAQPASGPRAPEPAGERQNRLPPVVVTANPLGAPDLALPVSTLAGDELVLRRASTLGETLSALPGVSASGFGPQASRPIIRGLDGERVRMLGNGASVLDVSSLSQDHAVAIDPLVVERIEVLRGPGALLYGGSAIGGVVNVLDNRVPRRPVLGLEGSAEVRLGGADAERGGAVVLEAGGPRHALHLDAFGRRTDDLRVPAHEPKADGVSLPTTERIRNSAGRAQGASVGGSVFFEGGRFGAAVDRYDNVYGVVVEPDVTIRMVRDHLALDGEWTAGQGVIRAVRSRVGITRYQHEEVEGTGEVGTTFTTRGVDARVEIEHAPVAGLRGILGVQIDHSSFSALGEEAFVPSTGTRRQALFGVEETAWAGGTLSLGARVERSQVRSEGDPEGAPLRFGPAEERQFTATSLSLSNRGPLAAGWSWRAALSATQRAPTSFELYANGVHAATGAFERGDPTLGKERGTNLDLGLDWKQGFSSARIGGFVTRFSRFLSLEATGQQVDLVAADGTVESFAEFAFRPVRAELAGVEAEGRHRLFEGPWTLEASGKFDAIRARNAATGEPLPRVAPLRLSAGLDLSHGPWTARLELDHAARQSRFPAFDAATPGYTLVHAALTRRLALGSADALWFLSLRNLGDALAYNAASIQTVRDLSPLAGRSARTGIRMQF